MKTDSVNLIDIMVIEKSKDNEANFEAFEKKMDKKHSDFCANIQSIMQEFIVSLARPAASFASVAGQQAGGGSTGPSHMAPQGESKGVCTLCKT